MRLFRPPEIPCQLCGLVLRRSGSNFKPADRDVSRALDNVEIAILSRLNELAERHGLSPLDFRAVFLHESDGQSTLRFSDVPDEVVPQDRFARMLAGMGITDDDTLDITGTDQQLYDTLQWAIQQAPKPPARGR